MLFDQVVVRGVGVKQAYLLIAKGSHFARRVCVTTNAKVAIKWGNAGVPISWAMDQIPGGHGNKYTIVASAIKHIATADLAVAFVRVTALAPNF